MMSVPRLLRRFSTRFLMLAAVCAMGSCTTIPELGGMMDRGGTSGRRIVVSIKSQKAELYQHGKLVAVSPISSGREGKRTPTGTFRVIEKDIDHRSSLYGNYVRNGKVVKENVDIRKGGRPPGSKFEGVPMPYFLRFTGAYGLHAGNVPGYPASSGCVRLPKRHAKRFYDAVKLGTPVVVKR
jgi:lipoprotein-anchoring transpeptidase ErfK/SrfK